MAIADLQRRSEAIALGAGFEEEFQPLGWGHGLGTHLFELPSLSYHSGTVLEEGMTFALEPMLVRLGLGTAVMEDTILVDQGGLESLSGLPTRIYSS